MKTKTLLLASLLVAALTAQAQTVTTNEGTTYKAEDLTRGLLLTATSINIDGNWKWDDMGKLREALAGDMNGVNEVLKTIRFAPDAVIYRMAPIFQSFVALQTVVMPTVVNNEEISFSSAFKGCEALTTIDLSSFTNIGDMGYAFDGCMNLQEIKLPTTANNAKVDFSCAFYTCPALISVDLSGFNHIQNMYHTFEGCTNLKEVKFSTNEHSSDNMSFEQTFYQCSSLASEIDLSGFAGISNMISTFNGCEKLISVKMPTIQNPNNVDLGSTFAYCSSLTSTIDLRGFTHVKSYNSTFSHCYKLNEIYLGTATASDGGMNGTFSECNEDCKVYLPEGVTEAPEAWKNSSVTFVPDGGAGIEANGVTKVLPALSHVYSIDGRLIKTVPAAEYSTLKNGLDRGIYIVNGEKMMVSE